MASDTTNPTPVDAADSPKEDVSPTSKPVDAPKTEGTSGSKSDAPPVKWPGEPLVLPPPLTSGKSYEEVRDARKPSIQIKAHTVMSGEPKKRPSEGMRRRISSPPPPPVFRPRVAFDTFEKLEKKDEQGAEPPSFTLNLKHKDYEYNKRSRTFLCGLDSNDYSEYALEWLIDELVDDGDEIVCLRVFDAEDAKETMAENKYREEAERTMKQIEKRNHENKAINIILEFAIGKTEKVIRRMIEFYEPAILIVGTRGRSLGGIQGLLPGSISKFCLQNSPIPVIVVRPNMQRARGKRKRLQDPARQGYRDLLDKAGIEGHMLDGRHKSHTDHLGGREEERPASFDESAAVAAAMGFKTPPGQANTMGHQRGSSLAKVESAATDATGVTDSSHVRTESEADSEADNARLMKSPELQNLESPELSGESAFGDDPLDGESPGASPGAGGGGGGAGMLSPESHMAPNVIVRRPTGELEE